jgi:tripartite-type tricarboxylate transporter receptor subunit TctC
MASAQDYPVRPVRMLVGFPAGSSLDIAARILSAKLGELLKQTVIVDNRAGAAGNIAAEMVARARPDGYTLLLGANGALAINPALYAKVAFDPVKDFSAVGKVVEVAYVLAVHPAFQAASVEQLIVIARSKPLLGGSSGSGSPGHLALALFNAMAGTKIEHVPYKGSNPALIDLMAGTIHLSFATAATAAPLIASGRLKGVAVATRKRSSLLPDLATVSESGLPGFEVDGWYAVVAPAGTPRPIIVRLNTAINQALATPDVRQTLSSQGLEVSPSTPEAFAAFLKTELSKWDKAVKASGAKAN